MITVLSCPTPAGWRGHARIDGATVIADPSSPLTWTADHITKRVRIWIDMSLTLLPGPRHPRGSASQIIIQGRAVPATVGTAKVVSTPIDPARAVEVIVPDAHAITGTIALNAHTATLPDHPAPADVLDLEAWIETPNDAMCWDTSRWDRTTWTRPIDDTATTLVWDTGAWDQKRWHSHLTTTTWTSIIGPATHITTRRGSTATGPVLKAEAGTLQITAGDALDPRRLSLTLGTPVRLYNWTTATPIWTGRVTDVKSTPRKGGGADVVITCADIIASLATTTRYGARPDGGGLEPWRARLTRLMTTAPTVKTHLIGTSYTAVCPTVWETNLAAHLDALVATSGGAWAADRTGGITIWATLPTTPPAYALTDQRTTTGPKPLYYTAGPATWDTAAITARIDATTHPAAPDENGEWRAVDHKVTVTNQTTATAWGGTTATIDLITPAEDRATETAARRLLARAATTPIMTTARLTAAGPTTTDPTLMTHLGALDPLTTLTATQTGDTTTVYIASITHDITPTTWETTLTLTPTERTHR